MGSHKSRFGEGIYIYIMLTHRSYDIPPPGYDAKDKKNSTNDRRYKGVP